MIGRNDDDDGLASPALDLAAVAVVPPFQHGHIYFDILQFLDDGRIAVNHHIKSRWIAAFQI
ncbi:MAG: hypothetical protein BGO36_02070 [Burkholderiales bacterium 68-10]|nr:MAG: hypothetical protein BGO36_02070 [Burkholderiales bacterium 68-10]